MIFAKINVISVLFEQELYVVCGASIKPTSVSHFKNVMQSHLLNIEDYV